MLHRDRRRSGIGERRDRGYQDRRKRRAHDRDPSTHRTAISPVRPPGLAEGWTVAMSRSRPGKLSYVNMHTGERISWVPSAPAPLERGHIKRKQNKSMGMVAPDEYQQEFDKYVRKNIAAAWNSTWVDPDPHKRHKAVTPGTKLRDIAGVVTPRTSERRSHDVVTIEGGTGNKAVRYFLHNRKSRRRRRRRQPLSMQNRARLVVQRPPWATQPRFTVSGPRSSYPSAPRRS